MAKNDTRKKYFKHGNPELYKYFTEATWKNMTAPEKEMWTPADEHEPAPIPGEVLNFKKENQTAISNDAEIAKLRETISQLEAENKELRESNSALKEEINQCKTKDPACCKDQKPETTTEKVTPMTEEEEKNIIKEELRKLGVNFHPATGLEKLKIKLKEATDNANNPK